MNQTIDYTGTIVAVKCGECGCHFGMPDHMVRSKKEDKTTFYCPNGHARGYVQTCYNSAAGKNLPPAYPVLSISR